MNRRPAPLLFSTAFGVLMVAAAGRPTGSWGLVALALSAAALVAGLFVRPASVAAVLITIGATALGDPVPLLAAVSGLAAAAYLVSRYAGVAVTLTVPTVLAMVGFTLVGAAATAVPLQMTGVPLAAPVIMVGILILVAAPLVAEVTVADVISGPAADREPPG